MGLFNFLCGSDINQGVKEQRATAESVLLDVRGEDEYREGHISGSKNIPLQRIDKIYSVIKDKNTPLYVYCYSGSRSGQATAALERMGYQNVKNIGGIAAWKGKVER